MFIYFLLIILYNLHVFHIMTICGTYFSACSPLSLMRNQGGKLTTFYVMGDVSDSLYHFKLYPIDYWLLVTIISYWFANVKKSKPSILIYPRICLLAKMKEVSGLEYYHINYIMIPDSLQCIAFIPIKPNTSSTQASRL